MQRVLLKTAFGFLGINSSNIIYRDKNNEHWEIDIQCVKWEIMTKAGLDENTLEGLNEWSICEIPLQKMWTAKDVAKRVIYLSDNNVASFTTGTEILTDGGMVL